MTNKCYIHMGVDWAEGFAPKQRFTPNEIEVLLHYHVSPEPHPRIGYGAVTEAVHRFARNGILSKVEGDRYTLTDRGKAWLQEILSVPYPRQAWVNSTGEVIEVEG